MGGMTEKDDFEQWSDEIHEPPCRQWKTGKDLLVGIAIMVLLALNLLALMYGYIALYQDIRGL